MVTLNSTETKIMVAEMKSWTKKACATSETARKTLMAIGVINKDGQLTAQYRTE